MLTASVLLLAMLGQIRQYPIVVNPPNGPATQQFTDFPVHVRILQAHWNFSYGNYIGWGRADILGPDARGFDFTYDCSAPFMFNEMKGEFYEARWKKPDQQLDLLVQKMGSDRISKCTLKTTVKSARYQDSSATWTDTAPAAPAQTAVPPAAVPAH